MRHRPRPTEPVFSPTVGLVGAVLRFVTRFHRPGFVASTLLGCLVAIAVALLAFDWNWLRGPLERYLSEKSGRQVTIADLHVTPGLVPTIRLRGVHVENAPWADRRPMAVAGEAAFTVSLRSIWREAPIISRLVLVDADVDLERQANGLRNWRLTNPEYRGPGKIRVLLLEARRSRIRFVNREAQLDLVGTSTPLAKPEPGPRDETLTSTITLEGEYQGAKFAGSALGGPFITFRDSNRFFPLRGYLAAGKTRLDFDGLFADLYDLGPMEADLRLSGPTLARLYPFMRLHPAPSRPYRLEAHVKQTGDVYDASQLRGKIGETDIAGEARYDRSKDRPFVRVVLSSDRASYTDLVALAGIRSAADGQALEGEVAAPLFPARALPVDALKSFDAEVSMKARELRTSGKTVLGRVHVAARLAGGLLDTQTLELDMAGGRVSGALALDARREPPSGRMRLDLQAVRLEEVLAAFSLPAHATGAVNGRVELTGSGASVAALLATSNGSLQVKVNGGRIPNVLDAKLALNPLAVLGAKLSGKPDVPVHCAAAAFEVRGGVGEFRTIALDTDRAHVVGGGSVNLGAERLDVLLTPEPKRPGIFDRREAIRVRGPLRNLKVSLEKRATGVKAARAGTRPAPCG